MIPLGQAQQFVLDRCHRLPATAAWVSAGRGLVLAEPVTAAEAIPPFANTAMDGYAVRAADTGPGAVLTIVGTIAAGSMLDLEVGKGQAARIMTGAPIPDGADAVIMVELTDADDDAGTVRLSEPVPVGNHLRHPGEDIQPGDQVLSAGQVLTPGRLGVLCSLGVTEVLATPAARVGVMSTGDELVEAGQPVRRGQIRDSNRRTLLSLVAETGCEPVDIGLIPDDEAAIADAIQGARASCDALITSGGVSMGDFDYVKAVLDRIGDMRWMQVAIKPAKPLAFGVVGEMPVFGLPGNPVSSMVSFELFARPGLRKMMGHRDPNRATVVGITDSELRRRPDGKTHFARVVVDYSDGAYRIRSAGGQGSHQLAAMAASGGLAILPDGDGFDAGAEVELLLRDR